jgi:hypothetical protein
MSRPCATLGGEPSVAEGEQPACRYNPTSLAVAHPANRDAETSSPAETIGLPIGQATVGPDWLTPSTCVNATTRAPTWPATPDWCGAPVTRTAPSVRGHPFRAQSWTGRRRLVYAAERDFREVMGDGSGEGRRGRIVASACPPAGERPSEVTSRPHGGVVDVAQPRGACRDRAGLTSARGRPAALARSGGLVCRRDAVCVVARRTVGAVDASGMAATCTPRAGLWLPAGRRARSPGVRRGP